MKNNNAPIKVFLSYSTENAAHQEFVIDLNKAFANFNIDATIDVHELNLGQDMYYFMESILDPKFDRVIILSDSSYVRKANARTGGVGAETQLLAPQVYNDVQQTRIIPIYMEIDDKGAPSLPTFLMGRFALDFSTPKTYEQSFAKLCLTILGEPLHEKPTLNNSGNIDKLKAMAKRKIEASQTEKNVNKGNIEGVDDAHIGDSNLSKDAKEYDRKNIQKGDIKNVKKFRLGDDYE